MSSLQVIAVAEDLQASLEDVFYEFQVDLTWHGHDHIYGEHSGLPPFLEASLASAFLHCQRQTDELEITSKTQLDPQSAALMVWQLTCLCSPSCLWLSCYV